MGLWFFVIEARLRCFLLLLSFFFLGDVPCFVVSCDCTDMLSDWSLVAQESSSSTVVSGICVSKFIMRVISRNIFRSSSAWADASCRRRRMFSFVSFLSSRTFCDVSLQNVIVVKTRSSNSSNRLFTFRKAA